MNYNTLMNKPTINYRELIGDNTVTEVGGITEEQFNTLLNTDLSSYYTKAQIDDLFSRSYVYREKSGSIVTFDCPSTSQSIPELTVGIEPIQAGTGDPSPTNVRPISGWTEANVVVSPTTDAEDGTTTPIAFTVNGETKTIYSGYVEIKNGKVKAVAESKFNTFTELSALYSGVGNDVVCAFISANEMKPNSRSNGMSNYFNPVTTIINENVPWRVCFGINNQRTFFTFDPEVIGGNTLADINNYVAANPIQVVYPLTTPIEYDLSDVSISTKDGTNNLWADSGDIEVKCLDRIIPTGE